MAPMTVKRKHLGVAVIDDSLYAVGGRDDNYELSSVERWVVWLQGVAGCYLATGQVLSCSVFSLGPFDPVARSAFVSG